jgi:murein DD-endopeptidase MepM/ murein hydrolase activator NlpD
VVPVIALIASAGAGVGFAQEPELRSLEGRMEAAQEELDAAILRIEELRMEWEDLLVQAAVTDLEIGRIERRNAAVFERSEKIARDLYMNGGDATLEAWIGSDDLGEVASRMEYVEAVGELNAQALEQAAEVEAELRAKRAELEAQAGDLTQVEDDLAAESAALQQRFADAQDEYEALKLRLEAEARREVAARRAAVLASRESDSGGGPVPNGVGGMTCPVDGPTSFIDSWGFPRSGGRSHEGSDVFAAMGTPLVAITDGRITYSGVGSLSGNWLILTGDDGHEYMYMHNRENVVTEGRVRAGQQIATVGDTGNAQGTPPHLHFEFHPDAGEPVNPYSLLSGLC